MILQITPEIEMLDDDVDILAFLHDHPALKSQVEQPDIQRSEVDMVLPYVMRGAAPLWFDLYVLVRHAKMEESGRWTLFRTYDFARRSTDIGSMVQILRDAHGINVHRFLETIRAQIKLLKQDSYVDFKVVPAQMVQIYLLQNPGN